MKKALIAYFSAGGTTAGVAKRLSAAIGGDLFEITPVVRYTAADQIGRASCRERVSVAV